MPTRPNLLGTPRASAVAMVAVGAAYAVAYPLLMGTGQDGWVWASPHRSPAFEHMLYAMYVTLGLFLAWGARDPIRWRPLVDYTIVANLLHATTMLVNGLNDPSEHEHLHPSGDVAATYLAPLVLLATHPRVITRHRTPS